VAEDRLIDIEHTAPGDTGGKATLERGYAGRKISPWLIPNNPMRRESISGRVAQGLLEACVSVIV
jgi:hypothetical protein